MLPMLGPAFVAAVAYVDPGNFATNVAGGAKFGYGLLWVVLAANLIAMLIQYLSAKLGIVTGRNLPELCRERFPALGQLGPVGPGRADGDGHRRGRVPRRRDRAEPDLRRPAAWPGLITGVIAFAILGLQRHGYRRFELAIAGCWASCSSASSTRRCRIGPSAPTRCSGLVPHLGSAGAAYLAVGIVGATVMPHVIYLHSSLTKGRIPVRDDAERRRVLRFERARRDRSRSASPGSSTWRCWPSRPSCFTSRAHRSRHDRGRPRPVRPPRRRRRGAGLRGGAARLRGVVLERRHVRRPGRDVGLHRRPIPMVRPPRGDDARRR